MDNGAHFARPSFSKPRMPQLKLLAYVWTFPNTLLGLAAGTLLLIFRGKARLRSGCVEFYGWPFAWLLSLTPIGKGGAAITLGHVIIGSSRALLDRVRQHELVHVRQYEKWGPFFIPAYLACSVWLWIGRRRPYMDNPFEIEAYRISDPRDVTERDRQDWQER